MSTFHTSVVNDHSHELFIREGPVESGTRQTSESDGHRHFVRLPGLRPGESETVETSPPGGNESGHQHRITVRAAAAETRSCSCNKSKVIMRNGVRIGIVEGVLSSPTPDCGGKAGVPDVLVRGAFTKSIDTLRRQGRNVPLLDHHDPAAPVGIIPLESIREDERGLHVRAEVNLETPRGRELHALAKQGAVMFSAGFITKLDRVLPDRRLVLEAELLEGSLVSSGCNPDARIIAVKSAEAIALEGILANLEEIRCSINPLAAIARDLEAIRRSRWVAIP